MSMTTASFRSEFSVGLIRVTSEGDGEDDRLVKARSWCKGHPGLHIHQSSGMPAAAIPQDPENVHGRVDG